MVMSLYNLYVAYKLEQLIKEKKQTCNLIYVLVFFNLPLQGSSTFFKQRTP